MELMDLYNQIKCPLDDADNLKKIVEACLSPRPYSEVQEIDGNEFYLERVSYVERLNKFIEKCKKDYLSQYPERRNLSNDEILHKMFHLQEFTRNNKRVPVFYHVNSKWVDKVDKDKDIKKYRHRFYINLEGEKQIELGDLFRDKCIENNIPYYFKFSTEKRNDGFVIYSSTVFLSKYLDILREIKQENPELFKDVEKPTPLAGLIDGWIGYGSEPENEDESFSSLLIKAIGDGIKQETRNLFLLNKERTIGTETFNEYLSRHMKNELLDRLRNSAKEEVKNVIDSPEFEKRLYKDFLSISDTIIEEYIKTGKIEPFIYNCKSILGDDIMIDNNFFIKVLKGFVPRLIDKNMKVKERYMSTIRNIMSQNDMDPNKICFAKPVVLNMRGYDHHKPKPEEDEYFNWPRYKNRKLN